MFVDASLPWAGHYGCRDFLQSLALRGGLLPPWISWWEQDVIALFPDGQVRARVESEQMRVSVACYDHFPYTPDRWNPSSPCAYVCFGEQYDLAAEQAPERAGTGRR